MRALVADQAAQPIRNHLTGNRWSTNTAAEAATTTGDPAVTRPGSNRAGSYRITSVTVGPGGAYGAACQVQHWDGTTGALVPARPGETVTISAWFRASGAGATINANIRWRNAALTQVSNPASGSVALSTTDWTRVSCTFVAPAGAAWAHASFQWAPGAVGQSVWVTDGMGTVGPTLWPTADGATPGWKWLGAAGASESVGYPYTLESIAGKPLADLSGVSYPGQVPITLDALPALAGRTVYAVTKRLAILPPATGSVPFHYFPPDKADANGTQTGYLRQDSGGAYAYRPQFPGGGGAAGAYGRQTVGPHPAAGTTNVVHVAMAEGLARFTIGVNGGSEATQVTDPGLGVLAPGLSSIRTTSGGVQYEEPLYAVAFRGEHNPETRKRVTAWLARRYGAPIPAGY